MRRRARRPSLLAGAMLVAVAIIGCSPAAAPQATPGSGSVAGSKISVLVPPWMVADEAQLAEFSEETGITVEQVSLPNEQLYQRVSVSLASQTSPADVIAISEEGPSFIVTAGAVAPLDDYIARDGAELKLDDLTRVDFWKRDGKQYGLTAYLQHAMLDYNTKKWTDAGLTDADIPTTWDEFRAAAEKIKSSGVEDYPVAFAGTSWVWYLISLNKGDDLFNENLEPTFNGADAPGREAMKFFVDLYKDGLISPDQLTARDPHAVFSGGVGTLHQSWNGAHAVFNNEETSKQAPNVRYMLFPEEHYAFGFDTAIGIGTYSKNKDAAWEYVKFYIGEQNQRHLFDAFGLTPARGSVMKQINDEGKNLDPEIQSEQGTFIKNLPRYEPYWGQWDAFVTETIRRAMQDQITSDEAIDAIAEKWNELKGG
jgi:multiple sugar transport system substrate-binding protein